MGRREGGGEVGRRGGERGEDGWRGGGEVGRRSVDEGKWGEGEVGGGEVGGGEVRGRGGGEREVRRRGRVTGTVLKGVWLKSCDTLIRVRHV